MATVPATVASVEPATSTTIETRTARLQIWSKRPTSNVRAFPYAWTRERAGREPIA